MSWLSGGGELARARMHATQPPLCRLLPHAPAAPQATTFQAPGPHRMSWHSRSQPAPPSASSMAKPSAYARSPRRSMAFRHACRFHPYCSPSSLHNRTIKAVGQATRRRDTRCARGPASYTHAARSAACVYRRAAVAARWAAGTRTQPAGSQQTKPKRNPNPTHLLNWTRVLSWRSTGKAICSSTTPTLQGGGASSTAKQGQVFEGLCAGKRRLGQPDAAHRGSTGTSQKHIHCVRCTCQRST